MRPTARTVRVDLRERSYDVMVGPRILSEIGERIRVVTDAQRIALVSDETVWALHGERAFSALLSAGFRVSPITVPAGEGSKSWDRAGDVLERLATAGIGRDDAIAALGGGVVGDLAGFAAALYMRGVTFVQIPTTLLAQVDSSIGGKTGVDLAAGKNLAGAFWQPAVVLADTSVLRTLSDGEWRSGLAELAKSAVLAGGETWEWLRINASALGTRDEERVAGAVERAATFKASVVSADERESGTRECLNYGHTFGHALERAAGYGALAHGTAVAEGMRFAAILAEDVLGATSRVRHEQETVLDELGLPRVRVDADAAEIRRGMRSDKKARAGQVRFVLLSEPGKWEVVAVDGAALDRHVAHWAEA